MDDRKIHSGVRIWIANQRGLSWCGGYFRHPVELLASVEGSPNHSLSGVRNSQTVAWGINKLVFFSTATTNEELLHLFEIGKIGPIYQIWPLDSSDFLWPPPYVLNDPFIDLLANWMELFLAQVRADNNIRV